MPPPPDRGAVGRIILVRPDGAARTVAKGLRFPNGIAVSADNSRLVAAEMDGECFAEYAIEPDGGLRFTRRLGRMKDPDGICLERDGAVWVASFSEVRVRSDRPRREGDAANPRAGPQGDRLCPRRTGSQNTVLSECRHLSRRTQATQIAGPDRLDATRDRGRGYTRVSSMPYQR
jgi:SMP-30/Gluconolactonase/LRE-like region